MKNQVYFPFSQSFIHGGNNGDNDYQLQDPYSQQLDYRSFQIMSSGNNQSQQLLNHSPSLQKQSTPLILAMNRLQKQSKSQMRKFGQGGRGPTGLNEIPGACNMNVDNSQQQHFQLPMMPQMGQQNNVYTNNGFNMPFQQQINRFMQDHSSIVRPMNNSSFQRDTTQSRNPGLQSSISANPSMVIKKKKKKRHPNRRLIPNFEEELNYDLHLDDDEKVWLQQFGNTRHGNTTSENEAFQMKQNTSHRGKYNSIEHGYQAMDTDAESHGFMQKRQTNNNQVGSRIKPQVIYQTQIPTRMGMNEEYHQLPQIQRNAGTNVQSKMNHYLNPPSENEIIIYKKNDMNQIVKRSQGLDSGQNGYHSFSSTKISEINPIKLKKPLVLEKNLQYVDQGILSDTYAGTTTGGEERKKYKRSPIIQLGGGLALKKNNPLANFSRHAPNGADSITFRDQNERACFATEKEQIILAKKQKHDMTQSHAKLQPKISMINMQLEQSVLDQLQNDELTDAQKHELVFDILKSHLPESDMDNINLMPTQQPNSSVQIGRTLPKQRSKQELLTNSSLNLRLLERDATLHPNRMVRVSSQKKKSLSPENEEINRTIANNLSTSRHINKYCRHCFLKALQEEQRTKKNHMVIYDANNCRKFIEKIKNINTKMHTEHKRAAHSLKSHVGGGKIRQFKNQIYFSHHGRDSESNSNSARMALMARQNQRNSQNINSIGSFMPYNLNRSADIHRDEQPQHHGRTESMMVNPIDMVTRKRNSYSGEKYDNPTTQKEHHSVINAGNYTIDIIRKSTPNNGRSLMESAKFLSTNSSQLDLLMQANNLMIPQTTTHKQQASDSKQMTLAQLLASAAEGSFGGVSKDNDPLRKKTVEISLAPDVIEEFQRRRAKYVIKKNKDIEDEKRHQIELLLLQSSSPEGPRKRTTYYERCKLRRNQLYGNKSQKIVLPPPSPPIEFEGPFLNVQVRVGSAPRSVHSVGISPLEIEMIDYGVQMMATQRDYGVQIMATQRDNSAQVQASLADHSVQMQVDLANANMQTTQHQFFEVAIETEPPPGPVEEVIFLLDQGTQTDTIGLMFLKRATQQKYQSFDEYELETESRLGLNSTRTNNKSVQANTRKQKVKPKIIPDPPGPDRAFLEEYRKPKSQNGQLIYHYLFDFNSLTVQVEIDQDEENEETRLKELERLRMLQNATHLMSGTMEPVYGVVKRFIEGTESYPSENYDWRQSGLYKQCLKHHMSDKEALEELAKDKGKKHAENGYMNDRAYRAGMAIMFQGDQHEVVSIENSQDASSNFNTKKDIQEQMDDFHNLNPLGHDIYKELEVTYIASILKKKNSIYNSEQIAEIHQKAITTLTVLTANLIQGETPLDNIMNFYKDATAENVTRLLVRCKKMYDARIDVKKIIYQIIMVTDLCQTLKAKRDVALEDKVLQLLRKLISQLSNFKHENKMFKAKFIYDGIDKYSDVQELEDAILSGEFYVKKIVVEAPKIEMKEQQTSITPKTQNSEGVIQEEDKIGELESKKAVIISNESKGNQKEVLVKQSKDMNLQTEEIVQIHRTSPVPEKKELFTPNPAANLQKSDGTKEPLLIQKATIKSEDALGSLITIIAIKNESPKPEANFLTFDKPEVQFSRHVRVIAPSHDIQTMLELPISPQRQVTILKKRTIIAAEETKNSHETKQALKEVTEHAAAPKNDALFNESMRIYEVKQGYAVYGEDADDNSSKQLTHVVSNHRADQKIYEMRKKQPLRLNESRPDESSNNNYSHIVTPRIEGEQHRDMINFMLRSQESPQKTFTNTQYSMKTMLVGHGGVRVNNTASLGQGMNGSYYSGDGGLNRDSNQTQQEWSQHLINQSHSQMSQIEHTSVPNKNEERNIISIEEQRKPTHKTQQISFK